MKTDNYLALCREQAAQSTLHHRHGAIVVRGGKVIGRGFNAYRNGFDVGALKTGAFVQKQGAADVAIDGGIKSKDKFKDKSNSTKLKSKRTGGSFVPFETMNGGGHHANTPLSMHSEMAAIHSALAASSILASTTVSHVKPSFKLSDHSKQYARLRTQRIKAKFNDNNKLVVAGLKPRSGVLKPPHLDLVHWDRGFQVLNTQQYTYQQAAKLKTNGKNLKKYAYGCQEKYQYQRDHHENHGENLIQQKPQLSASKHRQNLATISEQDDDSTMTKPISAELTTKHQIYSDPSTCPEKSTNHATSRARQGLKPIGSSNQQPTTRRSRNMRINAADLYVARFSGFTYNPTPAKVKQMSKPIAAKPISAGDDLSSELSSSSSTASSSSSERSLHDELVNPHPKHHIQPTAARETFDRSTVHDSRPCYRCVMYMHNVGIRRVFWTTDDGDWESAKVRDLVDVLDGNDNDGAGGGCGMFVTKHEVLMMRRVMGGE